MAEPSLKSRSAAKPVPTRTSGASAAKARTVLFADLTGANALYDTLGDARALMNITRCLVLLEDQAFEHRGQVIKTIGDEMLCQFPDANTAANAAAAMHQRIEHYVASVSVAIGLKIGLHTGPLIEDKGDVFGDSVNIAARLVKLAHPGQTLSDAITVAGMRPTLRKRARAFDRITIKGKSDEIEIVELGWRRRAGAPSTTEQGELLEQRQSACITLFFGGREIPVDSGVSAFTIGRDASSDLCVTSRKASRQHARIEWRRDKFVLFDHSTNGTYVRLEGSPEVLVKHESFLLRGRGIFSLGEAAKPKAQGTIAFECR
jgi:class 3 adenylate cyclase